MLSLHTPSVALQDKLGNSNKYILGYEKEASPENLANKNLGFFSEDYGFSFSYPANWTEIKRDLPDRF